MPKVIEPIAKPTTEIATEVKQTQVVLNLSLSLESLVEVITKLGLRELIHLKRSLDRQIDHALKSYTGDDELILDEIERQHPAYEATMKQAVQSAMDESQQIQKFTNGSDFRDWLVSVSD
jgi:hypothetical protein